MAVVNLPNRTDLASILAFANELEYYSFSDRITIDFGEQGFYSPFAMLFIATKLHSFQAKNPELKITWRNHSNHSYLSNAGFFRLCGLDYGRDIGAANSSSNFIPITCIDRQGLYQSPGDRYQEVSDLIQRKADELSSVLARDRYANKNLFDVVSYCLREIMRNVFEHSQADKLYYCAQYWPASNKVECAIADFGVGIRRDYMRTPTLDLLMIKPQLNTVFFQVYLERRTPLAHRTFGSIQDTVFT